MHRRLTTLRTACALTLLAVGCSQPAAVDMAMAGPADMAMGRADQATVKEVDLATVAPDMAACSADRDCRRPEAPRCDRNSGQCVACLPAMDNCPAGRYCASVNGSYSCEPGCRFNDECPPLTPWCSLATHQCAACLEDGHCPAGAICVAAACAPGCTAQHACAQGMPCCAMRCADTEHDAANCGACGMACGGGTTCCAGACADPVADPRHCGGCGMVCAVPHAMAGCVQGKCTVGACAAGYADCNGDARDGCEVSVNSDVGNCGRCGLACAAPNALPACFGGACVIASCNVGYRNCNGDPVDGCEIHSDVDSNNCGNCGSACGNLPQASAVCMRGACVIGACLPGFGNCDKLDNNGCEVDVTQALAHCGMCGNACPAPANVVITCVQGVCGKGGCAQGYSDCDNDMNNGCEARFDSDLKNCGKCGNVCMGMGQNAVAGCNAGVCGLSCNPGFGNCDGNPANGCELDLRADNSNCGKCGLACNPGDRCKLGVCVPCAPLPAGALSWWPGEDSAQDALGPNHGNLVNGATYTGGFVGRAFLFDGVGQFIAATAGMPTGGADRSLELWVRVDVPNNQNGMFAGYGNGGVANNVYWVGNLGQGMGFLPYFSQWGQNINGGQLVQGQWGHICATTLNGQSSLYVNGKLVASGNLAIATPPGSSFLMGVGPQNHILKGAIDEVTVYSRALSAQEVQTIYNAGSAGKCR